MVRRQVFFLLLDYQKARRRTQGSLAARSATCGAGRAHRIQAMKVVNRQPVRKAEGTFQSIRMAVQRGREERRAKQVRARDAWGGHAEAALHGTSGAAPGSAVARGRAGQSTPSLQLLLPPRFLTSEHQSSHRQPGAYGAVGRQVEQHHAAVVGDWGGVGWGCGVDGGATGSASTANAAGHSVWWCTPLVWQLNSCSTLLPHTHTHTPVEPDASFLRAVPPARGAVLGLGVEAHLQQ